MKLLCRAFVEELSALEGMPAPGARYDALGRLFFRFLDEATAGCDIYFAGPFAKSDYLFKQYSVPRQLARAVNHARARLRKRYSMPPAKAAEFFDADRRAVLCLICHVGGLETPADAVFLDSPAEAADDSDRCLRVIVEKRDGDVAVCTTSEGDILRLFLDTPRLRHLMQLVGAGTRLNLIEPRLSGASVMAEHVIFEPDYLVNITQVASCFESFGTDARLNILKKLSPPVNNEAVNLGNFASLLLDEEIHGRGSRSYASCVREFFEDNILSLACCDISPSFHEQARQQRLNIARAIGSVMPEYISGFDRSDVMLEPAFFCEMLGLQGRMDFLQLDHRVLVEQKAGKGEWPQGDYSVPRHRLPHYVQLLLYMGVMRYNFGRDERMSAFLLYSRYSNPLVALGFSPDLFAEALEVRNMIVGYDMRLAAGDDSFLRTLTADELNSGPGGKLWEQYSRPQLQNLLSPLASAAPLELAYCMRFMRFVAREHMLAKIGNKTKTASGFASAWLCGAKEKIEAGNMFAALSLVEPAPGHQGRVECVKLACGEDSGGELANFRPGDGVILYPYTAGTEPDVRRTMAFRATVETLAADSIVLRLRFAQSGALPFVRDTAALWAIEHDFIESSSNGLFYGLHSFLSAPRERRDLLLLCRRPEIDPTVALACDHGSFGSLALKVARARELFLIIGPPGTGKTSFGMMTTLREELAHDGTRVLLLSYTNRAVDEICSKLVEDGIDFLRIGPEGVCAPEYRPMLLRNRLSGCRNVSEVRARLAGARVVAATVSALGGALRLLSMASFSLAIIDEASQIPEPHLAGILSATGPDGRPAIGRIVMIGDHRQLPAVVQQTHGESAVTDPLLHDAGLTDCRLSLFERLLKRYGQDSDVCHMLTRQGRMHADIADFPSRSFYGGALRPVPLPHQTAECHGTGILDRRVAFVDVRPDSACGSSDKVNTAEARLIASLVHAIYQREPGFRPDFTVGVIVPYRNQISAVRRAFAEYGVEALSAVTVDTVERFQGSQREYIIYGFTVQHPYQLKFLTDTVFEEDGALIDRKLNVAMTRAREHLVLVGNSSLLSSDPVFSSLMDYTRAHNSFFPADAATI